MDTKPLVFIFNHLLGPDIGSVSCRRTRLACQGCYACSELDPQLLRVERFELDPSSRNAIIEAAIESRANEGSNANMTAAT